MAPLWRQCKATLASRSRTSRRLPLLSFLIHGTLERRAAAHGLSMIQTRLLGVLRNRRPTMNELAKLLSLDKSSATGLVDRAERRGLVTRTPSTTDRRAVLVHLTDAGRSVVSQVATEYDADVTELLDHLPASDRAVLTRMVSRVLIAHAGERGVDLFATIEPDTPGPV